MMDDLDYGFTAAEILQYFWQAASAAHLAALLKEGQPDSAAAECAWGIGWDANKDYHWLRDTAAFCALLKPTAECLQTHECAPCPHEWKLA